MFPVKVQNVVTRKQEKKLTIETATERADVLYSFDCSMRFPLFTNPKIPFQIVKFAMDFTANLFLQRNSFPNQTEFVLG